MPAAGAGPARVLTCAAWALILHCLALAWVLGAGQSDTLAVASRAQAGAPVTVRLVSLAPPSVVNEDSGQEALALSDAAPSTADERAQSNAGDTSGQAGNGTDADDHDGYLPRSLLTVAPQPVVPVRLPFPPSFQDRARYTAKLSLYIEVDGRVGRVEFDDETLPQVLAKAARQAFEHARFTPGERHGRVVKSLLRVEVDFDSLAASGPVQAG